jgi:hypothetical protein
MQSSSATCGIGCGTSPPPIPSGGLLPGGRTRRRSACPVPLRRGWRRRARANGAKRACLGGSWGLGELLRLIGGLFIGRSVEERGDQKLAGSGVLAAFEALSGHGGLGGVLGGLWLGRGGLCVCSGASKMVGIVQGRELLGGGPGRVSPPPSSSHGLGRGWGCWSRSRRGQGAWRQCWSEPAQCSSSEVDLNSICFCQCSTKCPQELEI